MVVEASFCGGNSETALWPMVVVDDGCSLIMGNIRNKFVILQQNIEDNYYTIIMLWFDRVSVKMWDPIK